MQNYMQIQRCKETREENLQYVCGLILINQFKCNFQLGKHEGGWLLG